MVVALVSTAITAPLCNLAWWYFGDAATKTREEEKVDVSVPTVPELPAAEQARLFAACDEHLRRVLEILQPEWLIGVGAFARERGEELCAELNIKLGQILHPSPASPAANRGWAEAATKQLVALGIWRAE